MAVSGGYKHIDKDPAKNKSYPYAKSCNLKTGTTNSDYILFSKIFTDAAYEALPNLERPTSFTETAKNEFWRKLFTQTVQTDAASVKTKSEIYISRILKLEVDHYRIFFKSSNMMSRGTIGSSSRVIAASPTDASEWWFDIVQPSLLDNVLFTDIHQSVAGSVVQFLTGINYDGPVHTNGYFSFGGAPTFKGIVSSAGCTTASLNSITDTSTDCIHDYGVYLGTTLNKNFNGTSAQQSAGITNYVKNNTSVNFNGYNPNFADSWLPLPTNSTNQIKAVDGLDENNAALPEGGKGLRLGANDGVQLFAGYGNGTALTQYDPVNRKWIVPEGETEYQFIRPIASKTCNETAINVNGCSYNYSKYLYRIDENKNISVKDVVAGSGWSLLPDKFNGLLYAENGFQSVIGPQTNRSTAAGAAGTDNSSLAQPAVASFMGLTLASDKDIKIRSDLALAETPCRNSVYETQNINPPCKDRKNVLGLYSQSEYIRIMKQAPNNVVIHAALMASEKEFHVYNHNTGGNRGPINLVGGVIEKYYGAVGTANPSNYSRDFSYDKRFQEGLAPPYFPVSPKWELLDARSTLQKFDNIATRQGKAADF
ncbi:DUF4900 domain-containing protein [Deinococcus fonticola]|uniref:DUF4900 domain-containing protein n=1 Tax=Deinococcus fonticola TaxID=2528713 RepID=UPI00143136B2|nr:DUF4900 domain-containing protein [Deinococcus fonticola]